MIQIPPGIPVIDNAQIVYEPGLDNNGGPDDQADLGSESAESSGSLSDDFEGPVEVGDEVMDTGPNDQETTGEFQPEVEIEADEDEMAQCLPI